jgi:acyl-CoA reductase-like NAD-dependent aldehyde dehydrogenase
VLAGVKARTINNGQSCIAAKRFIVHEEIAEQFEKEFVARMKALKPAILSMKKLMSARWPPRLP